VLSVGHRLCDDERHQQCRRHERDHAAHALGQVAAAGFTTVALTLSQDATELEEAVAGLDRVALVLGSEGHGLSERWQRSADRRAVIPMRAGIDSLNVAAAAAVACYVTARRRTS